MKKNQPARNVKITLKQVNAMSCGELQQDSESSLPVSRRAFLGSVGGITAALATGALTFPSSLQGKTADTCELGPLNDHSRAAQSFQIRMDAARSELKLPSADHSCNGDERLYPNKIGNYTKGLLHDPIGEVDPRAYQSLLYALNNGRPSDFENIILGGATKLVDPQAGLSFDLEGTDSHKLFMPPAPALASAQRAGEAVELYWMALLRDVPFSQYETDTLAQSAMADLNALTDFRGPKDPVTGKVTADTLFCGFTQGDLIGPYVSQFLLKPFDYAAMHIDQKLHTMLSLADGGSDYLTDLTSWLNVQNGVAPIQANRFDPNPRYVRNGRDLCAYVHKDVLSEAFCNACFILLAMGARLNPGNPYLHSKTQKGFGTFGPPHILALMGEVGTRALKTVWYQKWFVHRTLRPEEYGGLVHKTLIGSKSYPLHTDLLNSNAVEECFLQNGTYLLPHAFPEGCPQHPSYGQGHATAAGACATLLKAFFDENYVLPSPVEPSDDGLSLIPYTGEDAGQITLGGEANKLAANIGVGRNHAAVHWRSDYQESLALGEAAVINILRDQRETYNEDFPGFTFTRFDGKTITV